MKTIGLLGGMSMESTMHYIQGFMDYYRKNLGGLNSPKIAMRTVNFKQIRELMKNAKWDDIAEVITQESKLIEKAGADFLLISTNTIHKVADKVQQNINIPLMHITNPVIDELKQDGKKDILLLGTKPTMEDKSICIDRYEKAGLNVFVPDEEDKNTLDRIIFSELCFDGRTNSFYAFNEIILKHQRDWRILLSKAQGIVLGCTELELFLKHYTNFPNNLFYDTTKLHILAAAKKSLEK